MNLRPRRFRTRLLLVLLGLLVTVQGASWLIVATWMRRTIRDSIEENLVLGVNQLDRQIAERMGELADKSRLLAGDYALRQTLLLTEHLATIGSALESYRERLGGAHSRVRASRVVLISPEGDPLVATGGGLEPEDAAVFRALARRAEDSEESFPMAQGNGLVGGTLHGVVVVPVFAPPPEVVAWIGVAFPIDGALAADIKAASRLELSFLRRDSARPILASTLPPDRAAALVATEAFAGLPEVLAPAGEDIAELPLDGERFLTLFRPLHLVEGPSIVAALQRSLDAELAPLRWLQSLLLGTAGAGLLIAALLASRIARKVGEPVAVLAHHTRIVAAGDYAKRVRIDGAEEFEQLADAFNSMSAGLAERDRVRDLLDKNVSPEVAQRLLRDGAALGGEEREVTVLFSDLAGFTTLCETMAPRELVSLLNRYLERMGRVIEDEGGVIDKFIGDAIMAVFGAPLDQADHAPRAMRAALAMQVALDTLNVELALEGRPPLHFGVGINTAPVIAGNFGTRRRLNYSVIGDGVNIAARLQALTRKPELGTRILASAATAARAASGIRARPVGEFVLKGRSGAITAFAIEPDTG